MEYNKHLSEPWFSLIKLGLKRCEGRLNKKDFAKMKKGDKIIFTNNDFDFERKISVKITSIHKYDTFKKYLEKETLERCLPGIDSLNNGEKIYYKYYSKEDESKFKIIAIRFLKIKN